MKFMSFASPSFSLAAHARRIPVATAGLLLLAGTAFGGTLSVTSGPTITPTNVTNSSATNPPTSAFTVTQFNFNTATGTNTALKLSGEQVFTSNGGTGTVSVDFSGNATANAGDTVSLAYDFTLTLTGTGQVTPTVTATANTTFLGQPIVLTTGGTLTPTATAGSTHYVGSKQSSVSPITASGTFTGHVSFNWTGATTGDTLRITVPNNSIDFALAPQAIPEPGAAWLLLLGAPLLAWTRRR